MKKISEICLNFTANSFVFGRVTRKNAPGIIFVNLASGELPKCVSFTAKFFVFRRMNRENAPKTLLLTLKAQNSKNVSELHGKQLRFWTYKSWKCARNFFINLQEENFKVRLNIFHRSLLYILAVTWERLKSCKYVPHIFYKIKKICFVKFSPVKEIASNFASANFQNCCRLASKKSAESAVFFRLRGNTAPLIHQTNSSHGYAIHKVEEQIW